MDASLDYELGNSKKHLDLKADMEYCIGRDPDCPICLVDQTNVSRRHCVVYFNTTINSYALADLYSTYGTILNGRKIGHMDVPLHDGDTIMVGTVSFSFHCKTSESEKRDRTETTRISIISRAAPFAHEKKLSDKGHFRYQEGEIFQGSEKILEQLPSPEGKEFYLTQSKDATIHFLKIRNDLQQDGQPGRELRKLAAELPDLTGLIPIRNCGSLDDGACFILSDYQDVPSYAKMISMLAPLPQSSALALIYSAGLAEQPVPWVFETFQDFVFTERRELYYGNGNFGLAGTLFPGSGKTSGTVVCPAGNDSRGKRLAIRPVCAGDHAFPDADRGASLPVRFSVRTGRNAPEPDYAAAAGTQWRDPDHPGSRCRHSADDHERSGGTLQLLGKTAFRFGKSQFITQKQRKIIP